MRTNIKKSYREFAELQQQIFDESETPFNLAGELLDNATSAEGEARVRALAESEARKAQRSLFECGGTFDGFSCGSDADPGL